MKRMIDLIWPEEGWRVGHWSKSERENFMCTIKVVSTRVVNYFDKMEKSNSDV